MRNLYNTTSCVSNYLDAIARGISINGQVTIVRGKSILANEVRAVLYGMQRSRSFEKIPCGK